MDINPAPFFGGFFGQPSPQETFVNANKDRRLAGKKRVRARRQAQRAGRVLAGTPGTPEADAVPKAPPVALHGLRELEAMRLKELQHTARTLKLKGYSKLNKDELVEFIYRSDENQR